MNRIFLLLLVLIPVLGMANPDSLLNKLKSVSEHDRVEIYIKLSAESVSDSLKLAGEYAQKAYVLAIKQKNTLLMADATHQMGVVFFKLQQFDSALVCYQKAAENYQSKKEFKKLADVHNSMGLVYYEQNNYDSARIFYEKTLGYYLKTSDKTSIINFYQKIANTYFLQSKYDQSIAYLNQELQFIKEVNDSILLAKVYTDLSTNMRRAGNIKQAIEYGQWALDIYRAKNNQRGIADGLMNLGALFYYNDDNGNAIQYFKQALAVFEQNNIIDRQAMLNNNIGSVYNEMGQYTQAIDYYQKALKLYNKLNTPYAEAVIAGNLGLAYSMLGQYAKALEFFNQSIEISKSINNQEGVINGMTSLAGLYGKQGNHTKAKEVYLAALDLAKSGGYVQSQMNINKELSQCYEELGQYKQSLESFKSFQLLKDTLFSQESRTQLNELQTKFQLAEHQNRIDLLNKEKELATVKMNRQRWIMGGVFLIVLLLIWAVAAVSSALRVSKRAKAEVEAKNAQIQLQNIEIEMFNKRLTDSIRYASRVQKALLNPVEKLAGLFSEYLLLSRPQSIVSGDFYWFKQVGNRIYLAVADCTGHGVPGAFMSMLGQALLNEIIHDTCELPANKILDLLREKIKLSLHQQNLQGNTDGLDISLCIVFRDNHTLEFSGAHNHGYLVSKGQITEVRADRMPISLGHNERGFSSQTLTYEKDDIFYMLTDGFYDQFGGISTQKITRSGFKKQIINMGQLTLADQKDELDKFFTEWQGENEQTDDMLILAIKL